MLEVSCFSAYKLSEVLDEPSYPTAESTYSSFNPFSREGSSLDSGLNPTLELTYFNENK